MSKIFTLALLSLGLTSGIAHAQTPLTKGRGLLAGTIGYQRESYDSNNAVSQFTLAPTVGVFIADNLLLGINADVRFTSYDYSSPAYPADRKNQSFSVGPFARYYRFVGGDKFAFFGQGSLGYSRIRDNFTTSNKLNQGYVSVTPGLAFFPIPRFGLEASLRGLSYATNFDNVSSLDIGFSLRNFQLGAAYYFGK